MTKQQVCDIVRIIADAIVAISAILLVQSCVLTRNVVRHSDGVTIGNETKSRQSADSASINLKDFAK